MSDVTHDYSLLRGLIVAKYGTIKDFIDMVGKTDHIFNRSTFSMKLNNKYSFDQSEILAMCKYLDIKHEEIPRYFFTQKV